MKIKDLVETEKKIVETEQRLRRAGAPFKAVCSSPAGTLYVVVESHGFTEDIGDLRDPIDWNASDEELRQRLEKATLELGPRRIELGDDATLFDVDEALAKLRPIDSIAFKVDRATIVVPFDRKYDADSLSAVPGVSRMRDHVIRLTRFALQLNTLDLADRRLGDYTLTIARADTRGMGDAYDFIVSTAGQKWVIAEPHVAPESRHAADFYTTALPSNEEVLAVFSRDLPPLAKFVSSPPPVKP